MIKVTNLVKVYNKNKSNERVILDHISLEIKKGEMLAIVGKSGAGKSTLLQILSGITNYDDGEYFYGKQLIKNLSDCEMARFRNEKVGIVLQNFELIEEFSALENVILPLEFSGRNSGKKAEKIGRGLLKYVGIAEKADQTVKTMSGGEKQRVAIARALVNNPDIIFADEPTGALDSENTLLVMQLFHKMHKNGKTIVIVTHDIDIAKQAEKIIRMRDGKLQKNDNR